MIGATLSHADAAGRHWQFIVVGAGPGGSATALRLARAGRSVLLVDRGDMPRAKVCGCCLSATALHELAALDVFSGDDPAPVPLAAVRIVAGGRAARVPLGGATLSREALDTILVERAVEAGVHWLPEFLVTSLADAVDGVCLTGRAVGAEPTLSIACDHAVIATGLADHVRIDACIDPTAPQATAAAVARQSARSSRPAFRARAACSSGARTTTSFGSKRHVGLRTPNTISAAARRPRWTASLAARRRCSSSAAAGRPHDEP